MFYEELRNTIIKRSFRDLQKCYEKTEDTSLIEMNCCAIAAVLAQLTFLAIDGIELLVFHSDSK